MKQNQLVPLLAAGVVAAIQTTPEQAFATPVPLNTVTFTAPQAYNGTSFTMPITPEIFNANDLLSISGGSASGGESATFDLKVNYADTTSVQLYQKSAANLSVSFNTIPSEPFALGNITGLTFQTTGGATISIPSGTVFTFQVPEPASLALFGLGAVGLALAARRREQRKV